MEKDIKTFLQSKDVFFDEHLKKKKIGKRSLRTFEEIIEECKKIMADKNVSFDEIEKNTGVEAEFSRILFDDSTKTHSNIAKILQFLGIRFNYRTVSMKVYKLTERGSQIKIRRPKRPKCTMYYDMGKDAFFKFRYDLKTNTPSKIYTDIIKNEMKDLVFNYLEEKQKKNR